MKTVKSIMTGKPIAAQPNEPLSAVAQTMQSQHIGLLPVTENNQVVGVLTDRDIVTRGLARQSNLEEMCARDAMTKPVACAHTGDSVQSAAELMQSRHVHRLPVLNEREQLVGVVSVDDIARGSSKLAGDTLKAVTADR